jgi:hypothetical protein
MPPKPNWLACNPKFNIEFKPRHKPKLPRKADASSLPGLPKPDPSHLCTGRPIDVQNGADSPEPGLSHADTHTPHLSAQHAQYR